MIDIVKANNDKYVMTGETGSYRYMAPEVYRHEAYTEKVDIFSLGCIMFYLFMGTAPMSALPPLQAAQSAAAGLRAPLRPNLDPALVTLVDMCWHPDPNQRPAAKEVVARLEGLFPPSKDNVRWPEEGCCAVS
jgi:serine/threonine protein kinase